MTVEQSRLIHEPSLVCTNDAGQPLLKLPPRWAGLPLNLYRGHARAERGPCHVDEPVLILGVSGQCRRWYRQNGKNVELVWSPGMIDILGRDYQRESGRWEGTPGSTLGVHLTPEIVSRLLPGTPDFDIATMHELHDPKLQWLAQELLDEAQRGAPGGSLYAESLSCVLVTRLAKCYGNRQAIDCPVGGLSANNRYLIVDFIEAHLGEDLSIGLLAKQVGLSPHHFSHCFMVSFGQPPHRYLQQRRIEAAQRMLKTSSRSISEIAMDLGFSSQSHFTQVFRQRTGILPSRLRAISNRTIS